MIILSLSLSLTYVYLIEKTHKTTTTTTTTTTTKQSCCIVSAASESARHATARRTNQSSRRTIGCMATKLSATCVFFVCCCCCAIYKHRYNIEIVCIVGLMYVTFTHNVYIEYKGTVIAITHDRYFLDGCAGWIAEIDRGRMIPFKGILLLLLLLLYFIRTKL
jgi:hypothetical protein